VLAELRRGYSDRLVAVAVFGSVGRGTPRDDSDVDLLIIARDLPEGRMRRVEQFLHSRLRELGSRRIWLGNAWYWELKPDLKPAEVFSWP
jgi:predicted nucleotidyltransferase